MVMKRLSNNYKTFKYNIIVTKVKSILQTSTDRKTIHQLEHARKKRQFFQAFIVSSGQ